MFFRLKGEARLIAPNRRMELIDESEHCRLID